MCPIDNVPVKWHENHYLTYSSKSAKAKCSNHKNRRLSTYKKKTGFDHWNIKENSEGYEKLKATHLVNWGDWSSKTDECYSKFIETKTANGHWTNLRLMPGKENNGKGSRSDKSLEQLFEDFHRNAV